MIRSMTAFASAEQQTAQGVLECELRAVNHRFLELGLRLPETLRGLEPILRTCVSARVTRGKLDLTLRLRQDENAAMLELNTSLVHRLARLMAELKHHVPDAHVNLVDLLQFPGILQAPAGNAAALRDDVMALLDEVLCTFVAAREREGANLSGVLTERVDRIEIITRQIRAWMPQIRVHQRSKLELRLGEVACNGEPGRLEQELVLGLQKLDVDEELDRLSSHLSEIRRVLGQHESVPAGRRLDFLLQEVNREANTLGSKSVDMRTSAAVVELKVLIDQMREQVQNVE